MDLLKRHEGVRLRPYRDSEKKLTIGVGRNLDDVGITLEEAEILLKNDLQRCFQDAYKNFPWFDGLNDARIAVVISMIFNLGLSGFFEFRKMLKALEAYDYPTAAKEMLNSAWAKQVGKRAYELSEMMRTGQYL